MRPALAAFPVALALAGCMSPVAVPELVREGQPAGRPDAEVIQAEDTCWYYSFPDGSLTPVLDAGGLQICTETG
jgi:hypothetical protein